MAPHRAQQLLAVQAHVLRGAGLTIRRAELMHLNRECRYPKLSNLFTRADLTSEVEEALADVALHIREQQRMLRGPLPDVPVRLPLPRALLAHAAALAQLEGPFAYLDFEPIKQAIPRPPRCKLSPDSRPRSRRAPGDL